MASHRIMVESIVKSIGTIGGILFAIFVGAFLFLSAGEFSHSLKDVGNTLLWIGILIAFVVVVVVLLIMWRTGQT